MAQENKRLIVTLDKHSHRELNFKKVELEETSISRLASKMLGAVLKKKSLLKQVLKEVK